MASQPYNTMLPVQNEEKGTEDTQNTIDLTDDRNASLGSITDFLLDEDLEGHFNPEMDLSNPSNRLSASNPQLSNSQLSIVPEFAVSSADIIQPTENDVLLGRGGRNNQWSGNERLRNLAREMSSAYSKAPKRNKPSIAWELVLKMRKLTPPGRFLKLEASTGKWYEVDDDVAREKASQCLRDIVAAITKGKISTPANSNVNRSLPPQGPSKTQAQAQAAFASALGGAGLASFLGRSSNTALPQGTANTPATVSTASLASTAQLNSTSSLNNTSSANFTFAQATKPVTTASMAGLSLLRGELLDNVRDLPSFQNNPMAARNKRTFASAPDLSKRRRMVPTSTEPMKNAQFDIEPIQVQFPMQPQPLHQQPKALSMVSLGPKAASCMSLGNANSNNLLGQRSAPGYHNSSDPLLRQLHSVRQKQQQQQGQQQQPRLGQHNCFTGMGAAIGEDDDTALQRWIDRMAEEDLS